MKRRSRVRPAGIFCPVSSLPSRGGIGDFGPEALRFLRWLERAGQRYWQILPLTIPDNVGSPYASPSSRAGNWLMISPEQLIADGLLPRFRLPKRQHRRVQHREEAKHRWLMLHASYAHFLNTARLATWRRFRDYQKKERDWLDPFTIFSVCKERFEGRAWWTWPKPYRNPDRAERTLGKSLAHRREFHAYIQWVFTEQWERVRRQARQSGIRIIGDLPFYPPRDSVDVWANPKLFALDRHGRPTVVAGAPPDVFSRTGQKWGNPVYRWAAHRREGFAWWRQRVAAAFARYDVVRLDHFIGYLHTWQLQPSAEDGRGGRWVATPPDLVQTRVLGRRPRSRFIVDDLGSNTPAVEAFRKRSRMIGTRVFVFGWTGLSGNIHHPSAVTRDFIYYSSTHDSNTVNGWWRDDAAWYERKNLKAEFGRDVRNLHWRVIERVYQSRAQVAMVPIQDVFGLGSRSRLNRPGRIRGNWAWRFPMDRLTSPLARRLRRYIQTYA